MLWFLVLWPPLAFALVIAAASGYAVRGGATSSEEVGEFIRPRVPVLLALTLALVGLTLGGLFVASGDVERSLTGSFGAGTWEGIGAGVVVGSVLAAVYFGGLDRAVRGAQARFGDYVPSGSTAVLGTGGAAFFIANVVLAPVVEEAWYRGALFDALAGPLGPLSAAIVGCAAFGLFHWPGGAWYVVVTGVLVGGACWTLRAWDGGLAAPYAAHLTLNAIEYVVLTRRSRRARDLAAGEGRARPRAV